MRRNIYLCAWAVILSAFAVATVPDFFNQLARQRFPAPSPSASMDRLLGRLLHISQPSLQLTQTLAEVPADHRIIFISARHDEVGDFVYSAICYLTWPRPIDRVELDPDQKFPDSALERTAVLFCGLPAQVNGAEGRFIGTRLVLLGLKSVP